MKLNYLISILLSLTLIKPIVAEPLKLKQGEAAPYSGWLFSDEDELKNRRLLLELDYTKTLNTSNTDLMARYKQNFDLANQESDLWKKNALEANKRLIEINEKSSMTDWLYFGLGVLTTVSAAYVVKQAVNK